MDIKHLGRTGLKVSKLCRGTTNFGPRTPQPEAYEIMDKALDDGINFLGECRVTRAPSAPDAISEGGRR
jgi:aryl-alcohol dehydrogenase-like predicted oxidoreductase